MITARHAAAQIAKGQVVAYPTESFYALGADATNPKAVQKLFRLKKREAKKPVALIAADIGQVQKYFYFSSDEMNLAKKYWPGPVTILLQPKVSAGKSVTDEDERYIAIQALGVTAAPTNAAARGVVGGLLDSLVAGKLPRPMLVGVRVPGHARARRLASLAGVPLTATSANISGRQPTKKEPTIRRTFPGLPILKGQCGKQTQPSTVAEVQAKAVRIHRSGATKISTSE